MLLKLLRSHRSKTPTAMITVGMGLITVGMGCLVIALMSLKFLQPSSQVGTGLVDFLRGGLFGVSIGITLFAVILIARQRRARRVA